MKQEKSRQSLHMGLPELSVAVPQDLVDETDITPSAMHCCVCHGPGPATTTGLAIVLDGKLYANSALSLTSGMNIENSAMLTVSSESEC
jgi:hypothetical protein